jgi:hypothetical protein
VDSHKIQATNPLLRRLHNEQDHLQTTRGTRNPMVCMAFLVTPWWVHARSFGSSSPALFGIHRNAKIESRLFPKLVGPWKLLVFKRKKNQNEISLKRFYPRIEIFNSWSHFDRFWRAFFHASNTSILVLSTLGLLFLYFGVLVYFVFQYLVHSYFVNFLLLYFVLSFLYICSIFILHSIIVLCTSVTIDNSIFHGYYIYIYMIELLECILLILPYKVRKYGVDMYTIYQDFCQYYLYKPNPC